MTGVLIERVTLNAHRGKMMCRQRKKTASYKPKGEI